MKSTSAILLLLASTVVFGGLYLRQNHKTNEAELKVAQLQTKIDELQGQFEQQSQRAESLQTRLNVSHDKVVAKVEEVSSLQQAITNRVLADSTNKNPMAEAFKGVGEMFKNPDMKEFIKSQQKTAIGAMLDKAYASLYSQLGLSPDQTSALKDLIVNKSLVDAGAGMSMLSEAESTNRSQIFEQAKIEKDAYDLQIKQLLGDDNYKQFQTYEKSLPDRMAIGMFKDQQASGATPLSPDQEAQLVQLMSDERQNFKFTTDFSDQKKLSGDFASNLTEEKVNQFLQEQGQLNQRYLQRAQGVLSSDQMTSFEKFLGNQSQMQKIGLQMASKMFAPKQGN